MGNINTKNSHFYVRTLDLHKISIGPSTLWTLGPVSMQSASGTDVI